MSEAELDARFARLSHQGMFLFGRGLNSRGMDHWNARFAALAELAGEQPTRFERHVMNRVMGKMEKEIDKVMRKQRLWDEWQRQWDLDNGKGVDAGG